MADEITGTSVLQPTWVPDVYRLWFRAVRNDGQVSQGWIFIAEQGAVVPATFPGYPDGCNSIWRFVRGTRLDCSPSVNWTSWSFHNSAQWSTEYIEMTTAERAESKAGPEPTRYERGSAVHYDLSFAQMDGAARERLLAEWRAQGVVK